MSFEKELINIMGRVALNHSTHIEGLIPILKRLATSKNVKTTTPGVIKKIKSKSEQLRVKTTSEIKGGYKLLVRKGYMVQEVFVICSLSKDELEDTLKKIIINN